MTGDEARRIWDLTRRMSEGDLTAVDEQLDLADGFMHSYPWLWDGMIDSAIAHLVSFNVQLQRAYLLAQQRIKWCRDQAHLLQLARVCRARGGKKYLDEAERLELEAARTEDRHPDPDDSEP